MEISNNVDVRDVWKHALTRHNSVFQSILHGAVDESALSAAAVIRDAVTRRHKVLLFGNGGSAADAQHIAAEFVGKFQRVRQPLNAIALTVNTSILSAVANDEDYRYVFSRQITACGQADDVAIGISTSGKSKNVLYGLREANRLGMTSILLCGQCPPCDAADIVVSVPSWDTPVIQEMHILIGHFWAEYVEETIFHGA